MKQSKIVAVYPELSDITSESTERILTACGKILTLCAKEKLTISDMQSLPDMLCGEIWRAISKQISGELFKNVGNKS
jgi:hypothetical protein|nr:MAG: hypothetical protein [Bacteriophage sp.]